MQQGIPLTTFILKLICDPGPQNQSQVKFFENEVLIYLW